jgi:hypothetical protein
VQPVAAPPRIRPSGWWYLVAVGLAALGCVLSVVAVVRGWEDAQDTALTASAAAPGEDQPLTLDRVGGYTIAYSGPVIVFDSEDQRALAEELGISIVPSGGGEPLPLAEYDGYQHLEEAGQQYVPLWTVRIDEPGEYLLRSSHSPAVDRERSALILSDSPFRRLRSGVVRSLAFLGGGLFLGAVAAMIIGRMRGRAKAAARATAPPRWPPTGGWAPPPGAYGPPQQYGAPQPPGWGPPR